MKITALVSDNIARDVMAYTRTKSIDEAIAIALKDWLVMHKLKEVKNKIIYRDTNRIPKDFMDLTNYMPTSE
jgi:hypothetical protein